MGYLVSKLTRERHIDFVGQINVKMSAIPIGRAVEISKLLNNTTMFIKPT